jgi:hypothetical protein
MDPSSIDFIRIYPPLGLARVGNALGADDYIIGPETIGGMPTLPDGSDARLVEHFRTADGSIKRQAARFRLYAHLKDGSVSELTADDAAIEWQVGIANLKAGWYDFNQAMDLPDGLSQPAKRRNRDLVVPGGRTILDIVPTPLSIKGRNGSPVVFNDGAFWHKNVELGELRTDEKGRLLFLGGRGKSSPFRPGLAPLTFANNVGWHDDISDGPVRATITFEGHEPLVAEAGYVAVTPPNYAPGITGLVTLDDCVREMFLSEKWLEEPSSTSFTEDVWPIFDRLTGLQWVDHGLFIAHGHGSPIDARDPAVIEKLNDNTDANAVWRQALFVLFRDPSRAGDLIEPQIPQIYGDAVDTLWDADNPPHARALLAVTSTQYAHLRRWAAGEFTDDWPGAVPSVARFETLEAAAQIRHLERAALHDCLGGPFHPGIELTWVMRLPKLWARPYRLKVLPGFAPAKQDFGDELTPEVCVGDNGPFDGVAAGALTRFMGVPWQTDGTSCNSSADYFPWTFLSMPTFWGARVPDQVLAEANFKRAAALDPSAALVQIHKHFMLRADWLRDVRGEDYYERLVRMLKDWANLGMVLPAENPPAHLPADTRFEQGRSNKAVGDDLKVALVTAIEELSSKAQHLADTFSLQDLSRPVSRGRRGFRQGEI